MTFTTRVLRVRLKEKHAALLRELAREVNFVWNYEDELLMKVWQRQGRLLSGYDFHPFTKGAGKAGLKLHSETIQAIGEEYTVRRRQAGKTKLRWRASSGARRSPGWIPFKASAIRFRNGQVVFAATALSLWDSCGPSQYELGAGNFSDYARGRWYLNAIVRIEKTPKPATGEIERSVGIDLGLKDFAATSDAQVVNLDRHYRKLEAELAKAQRARKKARVRALHARIKNSRKDQLHKLSTALVEEYGAIFIGNVNASALARTRMAKSVLGAGWCLFRTMLQYRSYHAGVWFDEVHEAYSTQTCSCCNRRTCPKGREGLGIREWACPECGAYHHRYINAAVNILVAGRRRLAEGIPVLPAPCAAAER